MVGRIIGAFTLIAALAMGSEMGHAADQAAGDPYPLDHCVMSGKKFSEDTKPVVADFNGREIKFCCNSCKAKFEADPAKSMAKVDSEIVAMEKPSYPLDTCVVSGEKIPEGKGIDYVYNNRLVRLCCADCEKKIQADPAKYLGALDAAVIKAQEATYPLKTCAVSGEELGGSMGDPVKVVVGNQLVELCCKGCVKKLKADPAKYLSMIQDASKGKAPAEKK